jgi:pheromone shutdown protein TraB
VALFVYGFLTGGSEESVTSIYIWFLINGTLSAIGAALALGHPLTILSAFLAAPLTSLNPMIAAGWVSGLVQALVKKPTVKDLEDLPEAITTAKGFWLNPVSRILLVVVFSNLGSVAGTFIAGSWIAARLLG